MNRTNATSRSENCGGRTNRVPRDHYQEVTDRIIAALEAGTPPWRRPWDPDKAGGPAMPRNAATGHLYHGINVLTLGMSPLAFTSGDPRWATYKQSEERGWHVRKGEHVNRLAKGTPYRRPKGTPAQRFVPVVHRGDPRDAECRSRG
jgi:antirestriction protein ArdC